MPPTLTTKSWTPARALNVNNLEDVRIGEEDGEAVEGYQQDNVSTSDIVSDGAPSVMLPRSNSIVASGVKDHDLCFLFHYAPREHCVRRSLNLDSFN